MQVISIIFFKYFLFYYAISFVLDKMDLHHMYCIDLTLSYQEKKYVVYSVFAYLVPVTSFLLFKTNPVS